MVSMKQQSKKQEETAAQRQRRMLWFSEPRFGMFIR
jgi:hypothetical protein